MSLKSFVLSKTFVRNLGLAVVIVAGLVIVALIWMNFYTRHGQARPVPDFYGLSMNDAALLAKEKKLRYHIIDSIYTTQVPRGSVAEQNPKPGFKVKKWRNVALTINAFKPEMVAMPNLVDLTIRQASKVLESSGLEMGQRRFKPDISKNVVIEQLFRGRNINEGDSIQKGSTIDLVLGKGLSNERTSVPYVLGMSLDPAKNKIMEASLNLGAFIFDNTIKSSADSARAFVYKQNPDYRENASLPIGSDMYLWLTIDSARVSVGDSSMAISDTLPSPALTEAQL